MIKLNKTLMSLTAILALSAACSDGGVSGDDAASALTPSANSVAPEAGFQTAVPGNKSIRGVLAPSQPPIAEPEKPIITPASVTFASSREFQRFPIQPVTDSIFIDDNAQNVGDEYILAPVIPEQPEAVIQKRPVIVPTRYREVIPRDVPLTGRPAGTILATTLGLANTAK